MCVLFYITLELYTFRNKIHEMYTIDRIRYSESIDSYILKVRVKFLHFISVIY